MIRCDVCGREIDVPRERALHIEDRKTDIRMWYCWECRTEVADREHAIRCTDRYPVEKKVRWHA
jgi:hypothetical protein